MTTKIQIDRLGMLYTEVPPLAGVTAEATALPAPELLPLTGYHVNASAPVRAWEANRVNPKVPRRVIAGARTVCYSWPDKASFDAALKTADLTLPPPVPKSVTRAQARQALLLAGLLDKVGLAIAAIPDPLQRGLVQIDWDDRQVFERNHPTLAALAGALGMDDEALDQLFTTAAEL